MPILDLTNRKSPEELNKLPKPTNEGLDKLFVGVDKVVIKDGGVYEDKAMSDKIVLTISQADHLQKLNTLLAINEKNTGFYCVCLGTYAIELHSGDQIKAIIGFHHGVSIRYSLWNGDAELSNSDLLLNFLFDLGLKEPLQESEELKRRMEADKVEEREWLDAAPKCFSKYLNQLKVLDETCYPEIISDLNKEYPEKQKQIIALLQSFGKTKNFWTAYPCYEELPNDILNTFGTEEIIKAYLNSDRNYKTRRGLGRFLCSHEFKKHRKRDLEFISIEVIDDLQKCFDQIGERSGINEMLSLRNEKTNS